jgi:hypothetical protein
MARKQAQGGSRGQKGAARKPKGKTGSESSSAKALHGKAAGEGAAAKPPRDGKVGSEAEAAKTVGGKGDFGVAEGDTRGRAYTSANTRASDRGAVQPRAGEDENRTAGAGGRASGVGSSSGGDVDPDFTGVGTGGSTLSSTPPRGTPGPDDSDGTARELASGPPTKNKKGAKAGKVVGGDTMDHSGGDIETTAEGRGANAVSRPARGDPDALDDSFSGEVSGGEASGQDSR